MIDTLCCSDSFLYYPWIAFPEKHSLLLVCCIGYAVDHTFIASKNDECSGMRSQHHIINNSPYLNINVVYNGYNAIHNFLVYIHRFYLHPNLYHYTLLNQQGNTQTFNTFSLNTNSCLSEYSVNPEAPNDINHDQKFTNPTNSMYRKRWIQTSK